MPAPHMMQGPAYPQEIHESPVAGTPSLYKTDQEIAALVGVGRDRWREIVAMLERDGFPKRDPTFCNRRYWPACKAWLDRRNGLGTFFSRGSAGRSAGNREKENWT